MDTRVKLYPTVDGKAVLTVSYMAGEPRAWITLHKPEFQTQLSFSESVEKELCELIFKSGAATEDKGEQRDCPNCHVRAGYRRCFSCGTEWNAPEVKKCPTCGIEKDCPLCGGSGVQLGELQKDDKICRCRAAFASSDKQGGKE